MNDVLLVVLTHDERDLLRELIEIVREEGIFIGEWKSFNRGLGATAVALNNARKADSEEIEKALRNHKAKRRQQRLAKFLTPEAFSNEAKLEKEDA